MFVFRFWKMSGIGITNPITYELLQVSNKSSVMKKWKCCHSMWIDVIIGLRMSVFQIRLVRLFIATTFNTHDRSVDILLESPVDPFSTKRDLSASMHPKRIVCSILRSYQMLKKIQHKHAASICFLWSVNQIFIASKVWKQPS